MQLTRPWLNQYPAGVPAEIEIGDLASLSDVLAASCRRFASLPAFNSMGSVLTFAQLDRASCAFAAWLQKVAGLRRGDRVALMMPNLLQYPVAMFGALRAGLVVVNVNPLYTPRELEHQLNDSGAVAIVVLENFAHTLAQVVASTPVRVVVTTQVGDLLPPLKRLLTNVVVKYVKKMVPRWQLSGAVGFGERWGIVRRPGERAGDGWQVGLSGGVFAQFDMDADSNDLINADYVIGFPLTWRHGAWSGRFNLYHQSSHLGDELLLGGHGHDEGEQRASGEVDHGTCPIGGAAPRGERAAVPAQVAGGLLRLHGGRQHGSRPRCAAPACRAPGG